MNRILLIEDAAEMHLLVKKALAEDYDLTIVPSIQEAWEQVNTSEFHLILLDLSLPDGDGLKFCAMLKPDFKTRVIIISAKQAITDKVMGLSLGASDYIVKPFSHLELRARVDAHLRDLQRVIQKEDIFEKNDLRFNLQAQRVSILTSENEIDVVLTPLEFKLIVYLAKNSDRVLSRNQLLDAVWGNHTNVLDRTVDVHISNLRKKLKKSKSSIVSIPGMGYRFISRT